MVAATIVRPFYFRKKNAATETAFSQKPLTRNIQIPINPDRVFCQFFASR